MLSYVPPQAHGCVYDSVERTTSPAFKRALENSLSRLRKSHQESRYLWSQDQFDLLQQRLVSLHSLQENWDSYGAPSPNREAVKGAACVLGVLRGRLIQPDRVLASPDGGASLVFVGKGGNRAAIEVLNDETSFLLLYDRASRSQTIFFSINPESINQVLEHLLNHLRGTELAPANA